MDIHGKSVDMDMDGKFHIHGKPVTSSYQSAGTSNAWKESTSGHGSEDSCK